MTILSIGAAGEVVYQSTRAAVPPPVPSYTPSTGNALPGTTAAAPVAATSGSAVNTTSARSLILAQRIAESAPAVAPVSAKTIVAQALRIPGVEFDTGGGGGAPPPAPAPAPIVATPRPAPSLPYVPPRAVLLPDAPSSPSSPSYYEGGGGGGGGGGYYEAPPDAGGGSASSATQATQNAPTGGAVAGGASTGLYVGVGVGALALGVVLYLALR
jgi:hypothetical protein